MFASEYWIKVKRMNAIFFYGTLLDTGIRRCVFAESTGDDQMAIDVEIESSGQVKVNGNRVR